MKLILPPKRFDNPSDHKYDSIRYKPWFSRYGKPKDLGKLAAAARSADLGLIKAAEEHAVVLRDLQDYLKFIKGESRPHESKMVQKALDEAYELYTTFFARQHINFYLRKVAPAYGIKPRHLTERWEIDPNFYPSLYAKGKI